MKEHTDEEGGAVAIARKVHVGSFEILERLDVALGTFAGRVPDLLDSATRSTEDALDEIEEFCQSLEGEARYWEDEYDAADDEEDDTDYLAFKRDDAAEKLQEARRLQRAVLDSAQSLNSSVSRFRSVVLEEVPVAQDFLKQTAERLNHYFSIQPSADSIRSVNAASVNPVAGQINGSLDMVQISPEEIKKLPLPAGFSWLPIADIAPKELSDLPTMQDFNKGVSYDDMKRGFSVLEKEVLPVLRDSDGLANIDSFDDNQNASPSARKVFSVFFGKSTPEHIVVDRFGSNSKYSSLTSDGFQITNGKHRIKVAKDLGWKYVPAEVIEA